MDRVLDGVSDSFASLITEASLAKLAGEAKAGGCTADLWKLAKARAAQHRRARSGSTRPASTRSSTSSTTRPTTTLPGWSPGSKR